MTTRIQSTLRIFLNSKTFEFRKFSFNKTTRQFILELYWDRGKNNRYIEFIDNLTMFKETCISIKSNADIINIDTMIVVTQIHNTFVANSCSNFDYTKPDKTELKGLLTERNLRGEFYENRNP